MRSITPTHVLYIESGFLPIKTLVTARQLNFFNRYREGLIAGWAKSTLYNRLMEEPTAYAQHYLTISNKYDTADDIYAESRENVREVILKRARNGRSKYKIYLEKNPELNISPFINNVHPISRDIIRFRLDDRLTTTDD